MYRVLHILGGMNIGGIENFIMNVYRTIDRSKIQFDFLLHTPENHKDFFTDEILSLGGKIYKIPSRRQGVLKNIRELNRFFGAHNEYKVVHQHLSSLSYIEPLIIAKKSGIKTRIVHSHSTTQKGSRFHYLSHKFNQVRLKSFSTDVFSCSDKAAEWLCGKKQASEKGYVFIPNGIDPGKFTFSQESREEIRRELNIDNDCLVVGLVARLTWQKNHKFLFNIFDKIVKQYDGKAVLLVAGDGSLREDLTDYADSLGLKDSILFLGSRSDVDKIYSCLDIFVMPSINEGLPVTLIEAQAANLPCIVSDNITKMVRISNLIYYIPLNVSPDEWAKKCIELFDPFSQRNNKEILSNSVFDINYTAAFLQNFYVQSYTER